MNDGALGRLLRRAGALAVSALVLPVGCREELAPSTALHAATVDRACARIASCEPAGSGSPSECATTALSRPAAGPRLTLEWAACLDEAGGSCEAVRSCAPPIEGNPCGAIGEGTLCEADLLVSCWSGAVEFVSDCAAWGLTCGVAGERATCRGDGSSCLEGSDRCEGRFAFMCVGSREAAFDCSELVEGRVCVLDDGRASCGPVEDRTCTAVTAAEACEGTDLVLCSASGERASVSCTELGFPGCVVEADRAVCGSPEE